MIEKLAILLTAIACIGGAIITYRDFRTGDSRFWFSGGVHWLECSRRENVLFFWLITLFNIALVVGLLGLCGLLIVSQFGG